jgi:hypothetical protein
VTRPLKFPGPWFGGKARVARLVWDRLGDVDNFIECFVGSGAVLLARPHTPRVETVNDVDGHVVNVWRALKHDPEGVAAWADDPVSEADLHSRHRFLVGVERPEPVVPGRFASGSLAREAYLAGYLGQDRTYAAAFREKVRTDPGHFDVRLAGWYLWGLCCWIGGGWCSVPELRADGTPREKARGAPRATGNNQGGNSAGVHAEVGSRLSQQAPQVGGNHDHGRGVNAGLPQQRPSISANLCGDAGQGVHAPVPKGGRPQLADAYALGRGVHAGPGPSQKRPAISGKAEGDEGPYYGQGVHAGSPAALGTCAARRAWLLDWFGRLRDRLRCVRVCCGSWRRVCDSESVTTRLGLTGLFLDPPYALSLKRLAAWKAHLRGEGPEPSQVREGGSRADGLYATDGADVDRLVAEVHAYCLERGDNPKMRIALCGYEGEHNELERRGWEKVYWAAAGGYGNRSAGGKANARKERIWLSPYALREKQASLFDVLEKSENSQE